MVTETQIDFPLCFLVGFATVVFYSLHRLIQIEQYKRTTSPRIEMLASYRHVMIASCLIAFICCVILTLLFFLKSGLIWLVLGALSLVYLLPLLKNKTRVRDIPYLKIWAIALVWPLVTIGFPMIFSNLSTDLSYFLLTERFMFFILITLPFDIRDRSEDIELGLKTFATLFQRSQLNRIGLIVFLLISVFIWLAPLSWNYAMTIQIMALLAIFFLHTAKESSPLWYFSFLIDGLIIGRLVIFYLLVLIG